MPRKVERQKWKWMESSWVADLFDLSSSCAGWHGSGADVEAVKWLAHETAGLELRLPAAAEGAA